MRIRGALRYAGILPLMSNLRLPTPKLTQIIQFESSELSAREVARALNLCQGAISKYRCAVRAAGASSGEATRLKDAEFERRIWQARTERKPRQIVLPDCATIHTELKRRIGSVAWAKPAGVMHQRSKEGLPKFDVKAKSSVGINCFNGERLGPQPQRHRNAK